MNFNNDQQIMPRQRASCAAAAILMSTLTVSCVVWLFASGSPDGAGASMRVAEREPATPVSVQYSGGQPGAFGDRNGSRT
jgi:hypothetical protein